MNIKTYRIKQYNSTFKTVVCIDDTLICIVDGCGQTLSNIKSYLNGYDVPILDGKIKRILDKYREESEIRNKYIPEEKLKESFEAEDKEWGTMEQRLGIKEGKG